MKLKSGYAWIIKSKKANHPVVGGIYDNKRNAQFDFDDMPEVDNNGCGKKSDYEIVRVIYGTKLTNTKENVVGGQNAKK